ncbi:zinc finger protein 83-like [Topomyia yanbarensis]|uniref:zinc finger protein 83-like n=1 Tax=Topomyia yanbarensis TaxID=2498891 RepID=UPI00273B3D85|nr:zinc finger protein 83-like [Topomyia yanbarensis]
MVQPASHSAVTAPMVAPHQASGLIAQIAATAGSVAIGSVGNPVGHTLIGMFSGSDSHEDRLPRYRARQTTQSTGPGDNFTHATVLQTTIDKSYECGMCDQSFPKKRQLAVHKRVHAGTRPYSCDICGKAYTKGINLSRHKRIHTGERRHRCRICGREFFTSEQLDQHRLTHKDQAYICDICSRKFTENSSLTRHRLIHAAKIEKEFRCEVCGGGFKKYSHMTRHMQIHTNERPYKCDLCGQEMSRNGSRRKGKIKDSTVTESIHAVTGGGIGKIEEEKQVLT